MLLSIVPRPIDTRNASVWVTALSRNVYDTAKKDEKEKKGMKGVKRENVGKTREGKQSVQVRKENEVRLGM